MYIVVFLYEFCCLLNLDMFKQHSYINISGKTGWYNRKNNHHRFWNIIIQRDGWNDGCSHNFFIKIHLSHKDRDEFFKQKFYHNIDIFIANRLIWGLYSCKVLMFSLATHIIGIFVYCNCSQKSMVWCIFENFASVF